MEKILSFFYVNSMHNFPAVAVWC